MFRLPLGFRNDHLRSRHFAHALARNRTHLFPRVELPFLFGGHSGY
ncbi:MAG: hypothetical protein JWO80_664 [Bryobacterales bacterium]|nr:hypothetical protein [Bryobacterales bacterium]